MGGSAQGPSPRGRAWSSGSAPARFAQAPRRALADSRASRGLRCAPGRRRSALAQERLAAPLRSPLSSGGPPRSRADRRGREGSWCGGSRGSGGQMATPTGNREWDPPAWSEVAWNGLILVVFAGVGGKRGSGGSPGGRRVVTGFGELRPLQGHREDWGDELTDLTPPSSVCGARRW